MQGTIFRHIEKKLCRYTDHLITMNGQDYEAIQRYHFKPGAYYKVPGVGADAKRFCAQTRESKRDARQKCGIAPDAFVLIFAAEYSHRKNQKMLLKSVRLIMHIIPQVLLLLPGDGPLLSEYEQIIESQNLQEHVKLMGYRRDMDLLLQAADVAVSSALQEGLPINIVEAMAVSLPVVATRIRGHVDLVKDGENGLLVPPANAGALEQAISDLLSDKSRRKHMGETGKKMCRPYSVEAMVEKIDNLYSRLLGEHSHA